MERATRDRPGAEAERAEGKAERAEGRAEGVEEQAERVEDPEEILARHQAAGANDANPRRHVMTNGRSTYTSNTRCCWRRECSSSDKSTSSTTS